jgi:hypothetical protein
MFSDLQQQLANELSKTLKNDDRFDWVEQVTDYLEPKLLIKPRLFVKFQQIEKNIYWAVYVRKNICEVYQTTQFAWTTGRYKSTHIKMFKGKNEKPINLIIEEILSVLRLTN